VNLALVDTAYQAKTIRNFVEACRHKPRIQSSFGKALGPDETPFSAYKQRSGERIGDDWLIRRPQRTAHRAQHVVFEANTWRTHSARRLLTKAGDPGAVTICGVEKKDQPHQFLGRHLSSEQARPAEGRQRINEWTRRPGETENHWWDNFVNSNVAASILGAKVGGAIVKKSVSAARTKLNLQGPDGRSFFVTR
jgi:hypothetical protein